jgi:hypothetical protein
MSSPPKAAGLEEPAPLPLKAADRQMEFGRRETKDEAFGMDASSGNWLSANDDADWSGAGWKFWDWSGADASSGNWLSANSPSSSHSLEPQPVEQPQPLGHNREIPPIKPGKRPKKPTHPCSGRCQRTIPFHAEHQCIRRCGIMYPHGSPHNCRTEHEFGVVVGAEENEQMIGQGCGRAIRANAKTSINIPRCQRCGRAIRVQRREEIHVCNDCAGYFHCVCLWKHRRYGECPSV